ncbi:MAG TPA: RDD family protein [Solirubrobacteraceae bacterium]|nr:RDD family protein [Solirubrobacteraceae bacterium]
MRGEQLEVLNVASLRRRMLAPLLDTVLVIAATGRILRVAIELSRRDGESFIEKRLERAAETGRPFGVPTRWERALPLVSLISAAPTRNMRSPGFRLLHLRRVDARTGGPVTIRSAVAREAVSVAWGSWIRRRRGPAEDPRSWAGQVALLVAPQAVVLLSRRNQALPDRVAGILTVVDDGPRAPSENICPG